MNTSSRARVGCALLFLLGWSSVRAQTKAALYTPAGDIVYRKATVVSEGTRMTAELFVRAGNILNKLREREGLSEADVLAALDRTPADEIAEDGDDATHNLWAVVFEASRLDEIVEQVVRSLEFSLLAKYTFGLAQTFNAFYHRYPILNEERGDRKLWRAAGVSYVRAQLTRALDLMGIEVPTRM